MHPFFTLTFFFNDTATTEIYTLSLHDALPISVPLASWQNPLPYRYPRRETWPCFRDSCESPGPIADQRTCRVRPSRSEEHTSELQSHLNLVCRLLLEKKNKHEPLSLLLHLLPT